jgi:hypothetical protein
MAGKKIEYDVEVDASGAVADLKKLGQAGEKAGEQIADGFKDVASKSDAAFDKVVSGMKQVTDESKATVKAVGKIGEAFGEGFDANAAASLVNSLRKAGVEFDTIEGKADQLVATLREVDGVKIDAATQGITDIDDGLGRVGQSADGAKSALANMVGNAAQDLGALGGIAGSSGVAIGQLAEYFADARLDADNAGKSFGSLAKSFAPVIGPIAGISAALAIGSKLWNNYKAAQAEVKRQTDDVAEALIDLDGIVEQVNEDIAAQADAGDFGDKLLSALTLTDEKINKVLGSATQLGIAWTDVGDIVAGMGEKGDLEGFNLLVESIMENLGLTRVQAEGVAQAVSDSGSNWDLLGQAINNNTDLTWDQINAMKAQLLLYGDLGQAAKDTDINEAARKYLETLRLTKVGLQQIADAQQRLADKGINDPSEIQVATEISRANIQVARSIDEINRSLHESQAITGATEQNWAILLKDIADGSIDTQNAADAWNILQTALKLTDDEMQALVDTKLNEKIEEDAAALEEAAKAAEEMALAVGDLTESIADINSDDLDNLASGFEEALNAAGDLSNFKFRVDFDEAMNGVDGFTEKLSGKFKPDILELADFLESNLAVNVGDSIEWGEVKKDDPEFAALVVDMTSMIKEGAAKAYAEGGEEAAAAFVESQAQALVSAVPGLTVADVYRLLGLPADGSLDAIIKPIVDAEAKADALATLEALMGVDPDNPILAYLKLAVQTGTMDPVIAEIASLILAGKYGVDVEARLDEFTDAQIAEANRQIAAAGGVTIPGQVEVSDNWFDSLWATPPEPVVVPAIIEAPNLDDVNTLINAVADKRRRAKIDVKADNAGRIDKILDAVADQTRTADIVAEAKTVDAVTGLNILTNAVRIADIKANPTNLGPTDAALDGVAARRQAPIYVVLPNYSEADRALDRLADPRFADVFVRTHNTVTTSGAGPIPGSPGTLAAPTGFAAGADEVGITPFAGESVTVSTVGTPVSVASPSFTPTVHNHVTIQAAVIGSRYDVQRAVQKALRASQRLNGARV